MKIKNWSVLIIILLIATVVRLWHLGSVPPSLTPDEAAIGYNAYSILKTGRDEHGKLLPFVFKSFGDYKPGLYIYLTVPFVFIFGLTETAVRLPSVVFGVIGVGLIYLISKQLFDRKIATFAALILALNPWHIHFSRGAWEVNVALTLTMAGIYFFNKSLKENKWLLMSAAFFGLSLICYQGAKMSTGLTVASLIVIYYKDVFKIERKYLIGSLVIGFLISLPILVSIFSGRAGRLAVFSVFSYPRNEEYLQPFLDQNKEKVGDANYYLFHSENYNFLRGVMGRWFNHFSGQFLFFKGDWVNPKHGAPNQGMFLLTDLIVMVLGAAIIIKTKGKNKWLILLLLMVAPLPAALSRDAVHAVRSFNMVIAMVIIMAFGLNELLKSRTRSIVVVFLYLGSLIYFKDAYFIHLSEHTSKYWDYGYKQIVETVTPLKDNFETVRVQQSYAQPYIYFLFYNRYNPKDYQRENHYVDSENKNDVGKVEHLENLYFGPIDWSVNRGDKETLFVADTIRMPVIDSSDTEHFEVIKEIKYLDNEIAFRIIKVIK